MHMLAGHGSGYLPTCGGGGGGDLGRVRKMSPPPAPLVFPALKRLAQLFAAVVISCALAILGAFPTEGGGGGGVREVEVRKKERKKDGPN